MPRSQRKNFIASAFITIHFWDAICEEFSHRYTFLFLYFITTFPLMYILPLINLLFSDVSSNQIVFHIQQEENKKYTNTTSNEYLAQRITEQVEKIILHSPLLWYILCSFFFFVFYLVIRCLQKQPTTVILLCFSSENFMQVLQKIVCNEVFSQ